jgi:hypothetical protein
MCRQTRRRIGADEPVHELIGHQVQGPAACAFRLQIVRNRIGGAVGQALPLFDPCEQHTVACARIRDGDRDEHGGDAPGQRPPERSCPRGCDRKAEQYREPRDDLHQIVAIGRPRHDHRHHRTDQKDDGGDDGIASLARELTPATGAARQPGQASGPQQRAEQQDRMPRRSVRADAERDPDEPQQVFQGPTVRGEFEAGAEHGVEPQLEPAGNKIRNCGDGHDQQQAGRISKAPREPSCRRSKRRTREN